MNVLTNPTLCLVSGLAITIGCSNSVETEAFAIDSHEVSAISASISNHPDQLSSLVSNGKDPNIKEFKLPTSSHDEILGLLQGAKLDQSEMDRTVLGQLKITTPNGVHVVPLYSAGEMFIFDIPNESGLAGGQYKANHLDKLIRAITDAKKATEKNNKAFLIDPQDVSAISASISNHPDQLSSLVSNGKDPNIKEFKLPTSSHDEILGFLQGEKLDQSELDWPVLGQLKITTPNGVHLVPLYSAGKKFIFDIPNESGLAGGQYKANHLGKLIRAITAAKKATEKNNTRAISENGG